MRFLVTTSPALENSHLLGTDMAGIRAVKFEFFPQIGVRLIKIGYSIACCLNADAAVVLNVDRRAGWERTEHGLLTDQLNTDFAIPQSDSISLSYRGSPANRMDNVAEVHCSLASVRGPRVEGGRRVVGRTLSEAACAEISTRMHITVWRQYMQVQDQTSPTHT